MIIKENQVSFISRDCFEEKVNRWSYKTNNQNMSLSFDLLKEEVERIMYLGLEHYVMDGDVVTITQVFDDNTRRSKTFTGSIKINNLDIMAMYLLELVPNLESIPNFLEDFDKRINDIVSE